MSSATASRVCRSGMRSAVSTWRPAASKPKSASSPAGQAIEAERDQARDMPGIPARRRQADGQRQDLAVQAEEQQAQFARADAIAREILGQIVQQARRRLHDMRLRRDGFRERSPARGRPAAGRAATAARARVPAPGRGDRGNARRSAPPGARAADGSHLRSVGSPGGAGAGACPRAGAAPRAAGHGGRCSVPPDGTIMLSALP